MIVNTIEQLVTQLLAGNIIAFPTDTVYGVGCNAENKKALETIYELKNRDRTKPLILFVANQQQVSDYAAIIPPIAKQLMETFWPGALTIVLPKRVQVSDTISSGLQTIGLRMPNHPDILDLLAQSNLTLATTSANFSGEQAAVTGKEVEQFFGDQVTTLEGQANKQVASTVVEVFADNTYSVLRVGAISVQELSQIIGAPK